MSEELPDQFISTGIDLSSALEDLPGSALFDRNGNATFRFHAAAPTTIGLPLSLVNQFLEAFEPLASLANSLDEKDPDHFEVTISYEDDSSPLYCVKRTAEQLRTALRAFVALKSLVP